MDIEVPQTVLLDIIFEAVVGISYNKQQKKLLIIVKRKL